MGEEESVGACCVGVAREDPVPPPIVVPVGGRVGVRVKGGVGVPVEDGVDMGGEEDSEGEGEWIIVRDGEDEDVGFNTPVGESVDALE